MAVDYTITNFTYLNPLNLDSNPIEDYYKDINEDLFLTGDINDFSIYGRPNNKEEVEEDPMQFAKDVLREVYNTDSPEEYEDTEEQYNIEEQLNQVPHQQNYSFSFSNNNINENNWKKFNDAYDKNKNLDNFRYRNLLSEIAYAESSFINNKINSVGAIGYFQFMPDTLVDIRKRMNRNFSSTELKNNPELQIQAGINLAQFFENTLQKDLKAARQKGITMSGLIFGAWLGGIGGVRDYLYKGIDRKDANGTRISSYIKRGNNIPLGNQNAQTSKIQNTHQIGNFNVDKAIQELHYLTQFKLNSRYNKAKWTKKDTHVSGTHCARAVSLAMEAGGLNPKWRPTYAGDYGKPMTNNGWTQLPDNTSNFQKGDVCVIRGLGTNGEGHISMFDGQQWVSDFYQNSWNVYKGKAKRGINTRFYRYKG